MAKYDLKFLDRTEDSAYIKCKMKDTSAGGIICILSEENDQKTVIWLDKSTAIKFAKTLRTEINKIQD
tara:strand:- start:432 stop:635 length:204 start_codon:yes stop_codon:yes gene_type:complete